MGNCVFGRTNRLDAGTLSASSEALAVANLRADQADTASSWQASTTTPWLRLDAGSPVTARAVGLFRTNLTTAATVTVRAGTTAGASDVALLSAATGVVAGVGQWVGWFPSLVTARHWEIAIADTGNTDGFIRVGLAFLGPVFQPTRNFSYRSTRGRERQVLRAQARGGQVYPRVDWRRRVRTVDLPLLTATEAAGELEQLTAWADQARNLLFIPDPDDASRHAEAIYGTAEVEAVEFAGQSPAWRRTAITLTERL
ncbi:MAG: hypothetical protein IM628_06955 [Phenylobacterium sp.]|uniref:hypothetical protein n=1 Tax=Phenylobacterium sp. TaxID=1871053 RepID=UPI0025F86DCD|nr:hypothetical protein [Phenylobacterium sp.]MCA6304542.1 hypothetical protein [Phenylobacterium sp.]